MLLYTEENSDVKTVTVPNLTGLSISDARDVLISRGLNFETIGAGQNTGGGAYAVKQSIEPGSEVPSATVVGVEFRHSASD